MVSRKKQRTSKAIEPSEPEALGSRSRNTKKKQATQEELDLTASLFGTAKPAVKGGSGKSRKLLKDVASSDDDASQSSSDDEQDVGEMDYTGLEDVQDDQLFAFDTGAASGSESDASASSMAGQSALEEDDAAASSDDEDVPTSPVDLDMHAEAGPSRSGIPTTLRRQDAEPTARKAKAVWTDPATATMNVPLVGPQSRAADGSFAGTKRLRKLRHSNDETELSGREYERRLREMYEKMHPRPAWASRTTTSKADKPAIEEDAAESSSNLPSITNSTKGPSLTDLLSRDTGLVSRVTGHSSKSRLPQGNLEVERLRDASTGLDADLASAIECMEFHPSARSKILMTASRDRRLRLFQIDGSANPLLQTLHVPSLPLSTAAFHPGGTSILLSGPRPYFYSYDLQSGRVLRSSPWRSSGSSSKAREEDMKEHDLSRAKFQPLDASGQSRLLAIGGRRGAVHLVDWSTSGGGGGSLVSSLRQNSPLAGLDWDHSPGAEGRRLVSLSQEGTVSLWDVRNMRCEVIKRDVGLFGARNLAVSPGAQWAAVGSESGIVNMYDSRRLSLGSDFSLDQGAGASSTLTTREESMETNKSIGNLTTATTTMRFNHDGQMLALASRNKKDALRMVHLPSLTVFSNFPTSGTPLGHVSDVAFSTHGSQYVAIGNTRGRVLVYGLKHFNS